jgi:hypothetical protein
MTANAATVIAALHVSQRIKDYGSYAGFACVLGLAVLSLLYFAQAREVKRLREWAGRAPERDAELQARVTAQAQQRAATPVPAPPVPAPPAAAAAAATAAGAATAAKPAGAPATPAAQPGQQPAPKPAPVTAAATAAGAASASPAAAKPEAPAAPQSGDGAAATPPPATPKPATPAGANGAVDQPTQITPAPSVEPKPAPKPGQPLRPPAATATPAPESEHVSPLRTPRVIVGAVLAVIVIVVVLILTVFSGGSSKKTPNTIGNSPAPSGSSTTAGKTTPGKTAPVSRGDVTVAVLNGTTVPGLAREVGTKLQTAGFKLGTVTNAPDQARSATIVAYAAGHVAEARVVARLIHVGSDAVKPIDQSTAVVAGQDAFVVVTVGSDQSQ